MSLHIAARDGEIADRILLPGDPLRAKYIAEKMQPPHLRQAVVLMGRTPPPLCGPPPLRR